MSSNSAKEHKSRHSRFADDSLTANNVSLSVVLFSVLCLAFLLMIWSLSTTIKINTQTRGYIDSQYSNYLLSNQFDGEIKEILVKDGAEVNEGDTIAILQESAHFKKMKTFQLNVLNLLVEYEFIRKNEKHFNISFVELLRQALNNDSLNSIHKYDLENLLRDDSIVAQLKSTVYDNHPIIRSKTKQLSLIRQLREQLSKNTIIREQHSSLMNELNSTHRNKDNAKLRRDLHKIQTELERINSAMHLKRQELIDEQHNYQTLIQHNQRNYIELRKELFNKIQIQLRAINNVNIEIERLTIKSPITGSVGKLLAKAGDKIKAGQVITTIKPKINRLVMVTEIPQEKLKYISVGDPVEIQVNNYLYQKYGALSGVIAKIDQRAVTDERYEMRVHKTIVLLDKNYVGYNPKENTLKVGMRAKANITNGEQNVLQFYLRPVKKFIVAHWHYWRPK